ncbi:lasso peptide biosynthesis B2 protein [Asticcacaulis sp. 201]|uniref:lasso peptide biosynthesis B2 protein n=1 Tax=Asticcacaulis sp. 201 TaxID=3028787 RepID=UPI00398360A9
MKAILSILKSAAVNAYFRIFIAAVPFKHVRKRITPVLAEQAPPYTALWVGRTVRRGAKLVPFTTCLSRAMAARYLLKRKGYGSVLKVGVANGDKPGSMLAHAWLLSGDTVVVGNENGELQKFKLLTDMSGG